MSDNEPNETGTHDDQISVDTTRGSLTNLAQNFSQQQAKITALKQLVRQSEEDHGKNTASAQEKVKNIAQRLTHLKSKATRSRQTSEKSITEIHEEQSFESSHSNTSGNEHESFRQSTSFDNNTPLSRRRSDAPGSEKIQLLRQQMEQNRLRMAERESNQRGIEEMVTQLKAKFNSSQQSLDRAHLLGSSIGDLSALTGRTHKHQSTGDLSGGFNLERERIKYLEKRIKHLENEMKQKENEFLYKDPESEQSKLIQQLNAHILDLEENLKEKDGLIEARTKAANLISESLSLKGKDTVDLLEETKHEMVKMQENFVTTEDDLNKRIVALEKEVQAKDKRIANLEEVNDILETARFDLTLKNSELDSKTGTVEDYVNKLNELNKINETLQHRIESLENEDVTPSAVEVVDVSEYVQKIQQLETRISALESENDDLKKSLQSALNTPASDASDQERINNLEATISAQKEECERISDLLQTTQDQLAEKTVEYNVLMANFNVLDEKLKSYGPKSIFSKSNDEEAHAEINKLTKQLDEANKTGIKTKLKMKQLQKQIDTFKKTSDSNKELVKLMEENQRLSEKLKDLETENASFKSQYLQSAAEDGDSDHNKSTQDLEAKIKLLETTCQNQTSAIQLLEEQKLDMTADLNETKTELLSLKGHIKDKDKHDVTSEMDSIANEEHIENLNKQVEELNSQINRLVAEKKDLKTKLDRCISENNELLEKIDKLSKGSSVESIEILERLTQEEKLEMDRLQATAEATIIEERDENHDQPDDTSHATQSETHHTESIKEGEAENVQAKLQALLDENHKLNQAIEEIRTEKQRILDELDESKASNLSTLKQLSDIQTENDRLVANIQEIQEVKTKLETDIVQLEKERDSALVSSTPKQEVESTFNDKETFDTGLKSLYSELDNYRSAKERNAKVNASKRLARESKNVADLMDKLLTRYNSSLSELQTFRAEVEIERTARIEHEKHETEVIGSSENEKKMNELTQQIDELREGEEKLKSKCGDLEQQVEERENSYNDLEKSVTELQSENDRLNEQLKALQSSLDETRETEFRELQKQRKDFDNLLEASKNELEILRDLVNEQKQQLITAYTEHELELNQKDNQIASYTEQIEKLQQELRDAQSQMQSANDGYVVELNEKITSLQSLLDENKRLLEQQTSELDHKQSTIESLNQQIMDLYKTMESHAADLAEKDDEIESLHTQIDRNNKDIKKMNQNNLASERKAKESDANLKRREKEWQQELKEKEEAWTKQLNELENQRVALETKNKEQLEKLKKFAANLKKKNAQCAELEEKFNALSKGGSVEQVVVQQQVQKVESVPLQQSSNDSEYKEKIARLEQQLNESSSIIAILRDDIDRKSAEVENLKLRLSEKNQLLDELTANLNAKQNEIVELQEKLVELQTVKEELTKTADDLKAKNIKIEKCKAIIKEKNKEIKRLQELEQGMKNKDSAEISAEELKQKLDQAQSEKDKISEDFENYRSFIETKLQNSDLVVESIEAENAQLKERIGRLEENICMAEERRSSLERHSELLGLQLEQKQTQMENVEDEYTERLRALTNQDEIIEQKLKDMEIERDGLLETLKDYENQLNEWTGKNEELEQRIYELESTRLAELEEENKEYSSRIEKLEAEIARKQHEYDQKIAEKQTELTELENELSNHLQGIERERRSIQENLEKSIEENTMLQDQLVQLRESQSSLELSRNELEKEITWVKLQNDTMTQDQLEAQELRMQVVHDQTEVDNLHAQNLDLMEKHTTELNAIQIQLTEANHARLAAEAEIERLKSEFAIVKDELSRELDSLKTKVCEDQTEIVNYRLRNEQMVADHENELSNLHSRISELSSLYEQTQRDSNEIEGLRIHKQQLETEITLLRQQINALDALQMNVGQNITQDQMEVQQLRMQIAHDQSEIESLRHQNQQLNANHESELAALRQQIAELDSLRMQVGQNQTDDQVFIQNENERLQILLAEKEMEIQNYQRQNLQLQMSAGAASNDPFSSFSNNMPDVSDIMTLNAKITELEARLESTLHEVAESQRLCMEKDNEIARLQERAHNVSSGPDSIPIVEPIMVSHQTQSLNVSPFEIQAPVADPNATSSDSHDYQGQQIEDLQRNVSDLEKYVTDLEHKLKAANEEIMKYHVERNNFDKILSTKAKQYEDQVTALNSSLETLKAQLALVQERNERVQTPVQPIPVQQSSHLPSAASFFGSPTEDNPFNNITGNFPETNEPDYSGQVPIVEETIVPKTAWVCHPEEQRTLSPSNDDWGESAWGNDAILEEQHQQQSISTNQAVLNQAAVNLQLQIDEIRNERDNISTELNSLQTKYQKLLKKLKEYKAKIDEFERSKSKKRSSVAEPNDLDLAIQEELNSQIKTLEQKLKEVKAEHEKDAQEKKKLLTRVDVLTAANDRMIEMKDKQDIEIEVCKTKIRELTGRLEKMNEWGDEGASKPGMQDEIAVRLTETQNQNRLLEERIQRLQASAEKDDFEEERDQYFDQFRVLSAEKVLLEENLSIKTDEIATLHEKLASLEKQNDDFKATIELLSEESNNIKLHLDKLKDEHKQKIDENASLSEKLSELMAKNSMLANQVEEMRVYDLNSQDVEQRIQDLNASIQYKDSEIGVFNEKLDNQKKAFDQEYERLTKELANNADTIAELRKEIARLTSENEKLLKNQGPINEPESTSNRDEEIQKLEKIVSELREEKTNMETELQVLNDQVIKNLEIEDRIKSTVFELDTKNIEIAELKNSLQQFKENQISAPAVDSATQQQITELTASLQEKDTLHQSNIDLLNAQWQQVVDQKCAEVADSWRHHLQVKEEEFAAMESDLREKLQQLEQQSNTSSTTPETQNTPTSGDSRSNIQESPEPKSDDQSELVKTMQNALEQQEIEIVSLKEQLAIRSAEYARIAASVDPYAMKSTSSNIFPSANQTEETPSKGNELDLALYMLHQRDMRCEELTEEVIQLLEERDTLQLKLSNSIRQFEEFKHRSGTDATDASEAGGSSPVKSNPALSDAQSSHDGSFNEQSPSANLDLKLSELHNVSHSRDKTLKEEREQRRRQINLFQKDVANMPPEAIAELFGPDFKPNTRNTPNASSMLMDWLWGRNDNESHN